ncbi:MAG: YraN family protein [Candidatus Kaiserbacteria bacterium]|nr:YraN family protein [Candidatus Kaiserbacteria bacterium]
MSTLSKFFGNIGEKYAEKYLTSRGYSIIATQCNAKFVEIDILARQEKTLYLFEVKSVSHRNIDSSAFHPVHRVNHRKIKKMDAFATFYLNDHPEYTGAAMGIITVSLAEELQYPDIQIVWI